jgi:hypothetical protein
MNPAGAAPASLGVMSAPNKKKAFSENAFFIPVKTQRP